MVMPFTIIQIYPQNGMTSKLAKNGIFAKYHLGQKRVSWHLITKDEEKEIWNLAVKILSALPIVGTLSSPFIVIPVISLLGGYTLEVATPVERVGGYFWILPIILGLLMSVAFLSTVSFWTESKKYKEIEIPPKIEQIAFLEIKRPKLIQCSFA